MAVDTHVGTTAAQRVDYAQACTLLVSGIGRPTALLGLPSALALQTLMMAQIEGMQDLTPAEWETLFLHAALMAEDMCAVIRCAAPSVRPSVPPSSARPPPARHSLAEVIATRVAIRLGRRCHAVRPWEPAVRWPSPPTPALMD